MGTSLRLGIAIAVAVTSLAVGTSAAGADDAEPSSRWPVAADLVSNQVLIDLSGDGVHDVWVFDRRDRDRDRDTLELARRCRAAGLTPQQCRRILHHDEPDLAARCRAAGLTTTECRRLVNAQEQRPEVDRPTLAERCRLAGLTVEECRRAAHDARPETDRPDPTVQPTRPTDRVDDSRTDRMTDEPRLSRRA